MIDILIACKTLWTRRAFVRRYALWVIMLLANPVQVQAILYEWDFERDGGIYSNSFIEGDIFDKVLDGEVDIRVEQSSDFNLQLSEIAITYENGGQQVIDSSVGNPGFENDSICSDDAPFVGCVELLESDRMRFQHFFLSLDDLDLDVDAIVSASLRLTGSGLDFTDPDFRVRWDYSDLGVAHNHLPVPEPATLSVLMAGLLLLLVRRRDRSRWFRIPLRAR